MLYQLGRFHSMWDRFSQIIISLISLSPQNPFREFLVSRKKRKKEKLSELHGESPHLTDEATAFFREIWIQDAEIPPCYMKSCSFSLLASAF